jgi:hypothetical protein
MPPKYLDKKDQIYANSIPEPNSGCWLWLGCLNKDGYAVAYRSTGHRLSYIAFKGPIPDDCEIDHKYKVRCCVNPDHLEAVSHAENVARGDCKSNHRNAKKTHCKRGHLLSGYNLILRESARQCRTCANLRAKEKARIKNPKLLLLPPGKHYNAKLSDEAVFYIRSVYPKESLKQLGERFGVSKNSIQKIVKNKHYKHLIGLKPI